VEPDVLVAFRQACALAAEVLNDAAVADRWQDESALDGFTVGGLAAHLYAATRRFEVALDEQLSELPIVVELPDFYGLNRVDDRVDLTRGLHPLLREDAEQRAARGPDVVAQQFGAVVSRLSERLPREPLHRLVPVWTVPDGATTLESYAATRVVELVVHSDDLAVSVERSTPPIPGEAASVVVGVFLEMARDRSGDLAVIRAFGRRERATGDVLRVL
jgi:hypothetical protein